MEVNEKPTLPKKRKPRVERLLSKMEPLLVENTKKVLVLKGKHSCQTIVEVLRDFVSFIFLLV